MVDRTEKLFLNADDLAEVLSLPSGASVRWRMKDLIDEYGFPQPMPFSGGNGRMIWRAAHVYDWLSDQGRPKPHAPAPAEPVLTPDDQVVISLIEEARRA